MAKESLLTKIPSNPNLMQSTQYTLTFPQMPYLRFYVTSAQLPSVSTNAVPVPSPFVTMKRHGDTLVYDQLTVTILCDEDLLAWEESYEWLRGLTKPHEFAEYLRNKGVASAVFPKNSLYSDAILTLTTNANNPNIRIKFKDAHPVYLSSLIFSNADDGSNTMTFDVTFEYDYFSIERL